MSGLLGPIYSTTATPGTPNAGFSIDVEGYGSCHLTVANDGHFYTGASFRNDDNPTVWITPQVGMDQYEVMATRLDTGVLNGQFDAWLDCANSWQWGFGQAAQKLYNTRVGSIELQIRRKSDQVVVATYNPVSFTADGNLN